MLRHLSLLLLIAASSTQGAVQTIRSYSATPAAASASSSLPTPNTLNTQQPQVAQAREGTVPAAETAPATAPQTPSQNYLVYYYPEQGYRTGTAVGPAYTSPEPSFFSTVPWKEVGVVVGSLALVGVGGSLLYSSFGGQVKVRAMRELQALGYDYEDVSRVARQVLQAVEKWQNSNVESQ